VLAEAFLAAPDWPSIVIAGPDQDLLALIADAVALLPVARRWSLTFSTYFTGLPPKVPCAWRGVLAGSKEARQAARLGQGLVLDLEQPGEPHGEGLVELARTGRQTARAVVRPAATFTPVRSGAEAATGDAAAGTPFDPLEELDLSQGPTTQRRGPLLAAVGAGTALVVLLIGLLAWFALRPDPMLEVAEQSAKKLEPDVIRDSPRAAPPSPAPSEPAPKTSDPKPEADKKAPEPVAKVEPKPEPDPATAPAKDLRSANVNLPLASEIPARHDSADHVLDVPLPAARRFALRLRGLDDTETRKYDLVAQPAEPGRSDTLIIVRDPTRGGGTAETRVAKLPLARFSIEGDRLHFRWEPKLGRTLIEPALALRDCILEVRGGGVRLNVALRGLWKDPSAMTVQQGSRVIPWEKYGRPSRKLVIRSCEVKTEEGWEEIPPAAGDPNHRQRLVAGKKADPADDKLTLGVRLGDDAQTLSPELTPPVAKVKEKIASLEKEDKTLTGGIDADNRMINQSNYTLQKLEKQRGLQTAMLAQAEADRANDAPPSLPYPPEYFQNSIHMINTQRKNVIDTIANLNERVRITQIQLKKVETEIERQSERLKKAEAIQKLQIRLRLGITIEGEEVDVASIGPW
jgi:hypothetical protein